MHLGSFPTQLESHLQGAAHVLVAGHMQPDADCLGSLAALGHYLRERDCHTTLYCATPPPPMLRRLPGLHQLSAELPSRCELAFVVDSGDLLHAGLTRERLGELGNPVVVNIDHHQTNTQFGTLNLVLPSAATTEILYHYFRQVGFSLDPDLATALLSGIVGDTGGFQHPNTTPQVLAVAAELTAAGASLPEVVTLVFHDKTVPALRCWGRVLSKLKVNSALGVAVAVLSARDHADLSDPTAATSGLRMVCLDSKTEMRASSS